MRLPSTDSQLALKLLGPALAATTMMGPALFPCPTEAAISISSKPTQNMNCSATLCEPTAAKAVLNVKDLESYLASQQATFTVTTQGSQVDAGRIVVSAKLSWSSSTILALTANSTSEGSVGISNAISIGGAGGLNMSTGESGSLSFGTGGSVQYGGSGSLMINGSAYTLASDLTTLANDVANDASGYFALANTISGGTYSSSPISTELQGTIEGLGNSITGLTIDETGGQTSTGLLAINNGTIRDIGLSGVSITAALTGSETVGAVAGTNYGQIVSVFISGSVAATGSQGEVGGLVGSNAGSIANSHSSASVSGGNHSGGIVGFDQGGVSESYATGSVSSDGEAGGIAGFASASISQSFATGPVSGVAAAGGLVGSSQGTVTNSYATGQVTGSTDTDVGGLMGFNAAGGTIGDSYSTGTVSGGGGSYLGGLLGYDNSQTGGIKHAYWDTTTSGITSLSQGAGNIANDPGIQGLSSSQLSSGLPKGFKRSIWREKSKTNNGFPYLQNDPPPN